MAENNGGFIVADLGGALSGFRLRFFSSFFPSFFVRPRARCSRPWSPRAGQRAAYFRLFRSRERNAFRTPNKRRPVRGQRGIGALPIGVCRSSVSQIVFRGTLGFRKAISRVSPVVCDYRTKNICYNWIIHIIKIYCFTLFKKKFTEIIATRIML